MKAFLTGHRNITNQYRHEIKKLVGSALYRYDIEIVYCGMALGFDLLAVDELLKKDVKIHAVIPFPQQPERWGDDDKKTYNRILDLCSEKTILSQEYYHGCLLNRNLWMISRSQLCISCWDGRKMGGTFHAVNHSSHMERLNLNLKSKNIELVLPRYMQPSLFFD